MRSSFEPKHLQRAKETLHRQLETVQKEIAVTPVEEQETKTKQGIFKHVRDFVKRFF